VIDAPAPAQPRRRTTVPRGAVLALVAAALGGIGVGLLVHVLATSPNVGHTSSAGAGLRGQATWAPGAQPAPEIASLRDQTGHVFALSMLRGRAVAMTFFDSHCNQACPLEGRAIGVAMRALPVSRRPALVVVSVNPRDTPASERAAIQRWGLPAGITWHWLSGTHAQLAPVWHAYHVFVAPGRGDIVHTEALYLLDRRGDERSGYLYPFLPASVGHDLGILAPKGVGHV
jgi:protein SCO1